MFQVICSDVPTDLTDFAFDHLKDDIPFAENIELDYQNQIVYVDVGDMKKPTIVQEKIQQRANEKVVDMKTEVNNGYDIGYSKVELSNIQQKINNSSSFEIQAE